MTREIWLCISDLKEVLKEADERRELMGVKYAKLDCKDVYEVIYYAANLL